LYLHVSQVYEVRSPLWKTRFLERWSLFMTCFFGIDIAK
jgi:hypothetical protein